MGRNREYRYFSCDFETTVYKGQTNTEVWASACVELFTEDVQIFHSIGETFEYFKSLKSNLICYYHNLKFDGNFWLSYLLCDLKMKQALEKTGDGEYDVRFVQEKFMENGTFRYSISDMGQWYSITIKVNNYIIEIRDSLKLIPFSVRQIGEDFKTKHKKLEMEYSGFRYAGCTITDEERKYIANDVLVVKEALEFMFNEGHNKLTIGSCCLEEYKTIMGKKEYEEVFPDLYKMTILSDAHGTDNAGEWLRRSYKGGWCYLVKGKENKLYHNGTTADVNSLYPSMMSSESGNEYPYGSPRFWTGNKIPPEAKMPHRYYFVRIKTRFYLKEGKLPFIQIKGSYLYKSTEALETSDVYNRNTGEYSPYYKDMNGEIKDTRVILTLTCTDYELFLEHYNVIDFEILDGCYFASMKGIFDDYIEKYKKLKLESKGALRTLAKLFLNNLYGKMATSMDSSFKVAYVNDNGVVCFTTVQAYDKTPGFIAIGSAITSYARNFTIRAAQKNYYGKDKAGFIYADTDSIHCDLLPEQIVGITVHEKNFCCWKLETCWDVGIFARQKTYIEHVTHEDLVPVTTLKDKQGNQREPYWNIKCAGMPERCKDLFEKSMNGYVPQKGDDFTENQLEFLKKKRTLEDFKTGLKVPGKLLPKRIQGGVLLVDTYYEMRE